MSEVMNTLLSNPYFVGCAMAVIVFAITQLLKMPIKHYTNKIADKSLRKKVNATILLIPFVVGCLLELLYSTLYLHTSFSFLSGLGYGTAGISLYGVIERFLGVKIENVYETTEEGQAVTELVNNVVADGKVDEQDKDVIKEFLDKVNR